MIKLIVTDMDGTLLDSEHNINPEFWTVYNEIKRKGIKFCVASGRQYFNLIENFKDIKNEIFYIAENGAYTALGNESLNFKEINREYVDEFISISKKIDGVGIVLCGKNSAYINDTRPEFIAEVEKYYHKYEIVRDLEKVEDIILKIAIYDFVSSEKNSYPHYKKFEDKFKIVISSQYWLDIMDLNANKGLALKEIQKKLNVEKYETLAFGDYMNDYEMLQEAEYSYAMAEAHPELKKIAKFIAPSNNDNGVVNIIKEYLK